MSLVEHEFLKVYLTKPTWCDACGKFMWGIVSKQGHRCQRCGVTVHEQCLPAAEKAAGAEDEGGGLAACFKDTSSDTRLVVNVLGAKDLLGKDSSGFSDPFCVIEYGSQKFKTKKHMQTVNPRFNQRLFFDANDSADTEGRLVVNVYDWDRFTSNDFLGQVSLEVASLPFEEPHAVYDAWVPLQSRPGKKDKVGGELHVVVQRLVRDADGEWTELVDKLHRTQSEVLTANDGTPIGFRYATEILIRGGFSSKESKSSSWRLCWVEVVPRYMRFYKSKVDAEQAGDKPLLQLDFEEITRVNSVPKLTLTPSKKRGSVGSISKGTGSGGSISGGKGSSRGRPVDPTCIFEVESTVQQNRTFGLALESPEVSATCMLILASLAHIENPSREVLASYERSVLLQKAFLVTHKGGMINSSFEELWCMSATGGVISSSTGVVDPIHGTELSVEYVWDGEFLVPKSGHDYGRGSWDGVVASWDGGSEDRYAKSFVYNPEDEEFCASDGEAWKFTRHFLANKADGGQYWLLEGDVPRPVLMLLQMLRCTRLGLSPVFGE